MGKVICMFTREDITNEPTPMTKEQGEALIADLLKLEAKHTDSPFTGTASVFQGLINMVENASGASGYEVMDRLYNTGTGAL